MGPSDHDLRYMQRALDLAARGEGWVEPNPQVGCVIVRDGTIVGEGWHRRFGGPHAEIEALTHAGSSAAGATLYVTLEPCSHFGKTPPCVDAIIAAGLRRVVAAQRDPFPQVAGSGLKRLEAAGLQVEVGLGAQAAAELNAPYLTRLLAGRPWVIAKWAMTLDGKTGPALPPGGRCGLPARTVSNEASRALGHALRGRMDAILVGRGTVEADDPLLTARPAGARIPARIVLDSQARLSLDAQLVRTIAEAPVLVVTAPDAPSARLAALRQRGCEVWVSRSPARGEQIVELLAELGRRGMTNLLVEGGGEVLGTFRDAGRIDEVHVFLAPRLAGGAAAPVPVRGTGCEDLRAAASLYNVTWSQVGDDLYFRARVARG